MRPMRVLLLLLAASYATADKLYLLGGFYAARAGAFGAEIPNYIKALNIMYAPVNAGYRSICEYPEDFYNLTEAQIPSTVNTVDSPIAFLVELAACSPERQAMIAGRIRQNISDKVRYLLFYGEPDDGDALKVIYRQTDAAPTPYEDKIGILYVTYRSGVLLQRHVADEKVTGGGSPFFMSEGNQNWRLQGSLEPYFSGNFRSNDDRTDNFYWFRILLFTLLIVSPCVRAGYLWWTGGGRIHFRRNENGRIIGFQYVPPIPYWLSAGMIPGRPMEPTSSTLSEEKFNELPTILYQPPDDATERHEEDVETATVAITTGGTSEPTPPTGSEHPPESAPPIMGPLSQDLRTTCTMCSICIDDFELNERLVILPRCSHAFHNDCIKPWLTERQGCCPLCKTDVLEDEGRTESVESSIPGSVDAVEAPSTSSASSQDPVGEDTREEPIADATPEVTEASHETPMREDLPNTWDTGVNGDDSERRTAR